MSITATMDHPTDAPDGGLRLGVATLASALPFLVRRDDPHPAACLREDFGRDVAAARTLLSPASDLPTLLGLVHALTRDHAAVAPGLDRAGVGGRDLIEVSSLEAPMDQRPFSWAAQRLATDAFSVAIAVRWQELHAGVDLPAWLELLRRHSPAERPIDPDLDRTIWFG